MADDAVVAPVQPVVWLQYTVCCSKCLFWGTLVPLWVWMYCDLRCFYRGLRMILPFAAFGLQEMVMPTMSPGISVDGVPGLLEVNTWPSYCARSMVSRRAGAWQLKWCLFCEHTWGFQQWIQVRVPIVVWSLKPLFYSFLVVVVLRWGPLVFMPNRGDARPKKRRRTDWPGKVNLKPSSLANFFHFFSIFFQPSPNLLSILVMPCHMQAAAHGDGDSNARDWCAAKKGVHFVPVGSLQLESWYQLAALGAKTVFLRCRTTGLFAFCFEALSSRDMWQILVHTDTQIHLQWHLHIHIHIHVHMQFCFLHINICKWIYIYIFTYAHTCT